MKPHPQGPADAEQTTPTSAPANRKSKVMPDDVVVSTFTTVDLKPEVSAKQGLDQFVEELLKKLEKVKNERHAYYEGLRERNSRWANGSRKALTVLGAIAFLLTALAAGLSFAPPDWKLPGTDSMLAGSQRPTLIAVLAIYAVMGAMTFYEKGTDKTAAYFRHLSIILSIRDLWTKLQFELLKELMAQQSAADPKAAEPATRERIRTLAEAFCNDLNKTSAGELAEWRTEFMTSLSELAQAAQKGAEDVTKQVQELAKAAAKAVIDAKAAAEKAAAEAQAAAKAAAEAGKPGAINVTLSGDFDGEVALSIDGAEVVRSHGKTIAVDRVPPGIRKISAQAQKGEKKFAASKMVEVKPGGLQELPLSLT
jgi:hypothetical protein